MQKNPSFSELFIWASARSQFLNVLVRVIALASSFLILKVLSVYEFGLYQLILAAVALAQSVNSGLFDDIAVNEIARSFADGLTSRAKRLFREYFFVKLLIGALAAAVLYFGAGIVASYYDKDIASYVRLASILVLIAPIRVVQSIFFRATVSFSAFGAEAVQEIAKLGFLGFWWYEGILGIREILIANIAGAVLALAYTSFWFIQQYRKHFSEVIADSARVLTGLVREYGRWIFLRYGISRAFKGSDVWFVRLFLNTEAVAFYSLAMNLISLLQGIFPTDILGTLLPWELKDKRRLHYIYQRMVKYGLLMGIAVGIGAFIFVPKLIALFFPKYLPAMPVFLWMLVTLPLYAVYKSQKTFLTVLREQKILTMRLVTEQGVVIAILAIFLPFIGIYAAVLSYLVTYAGRVTLFAVYLGRSYPELRLKIKGLVSFDHDDWVFFRRVVRESLKPLRWLGPIKARI